MSPAYRFPTSERFTCEGCTKCCRAFPIPLTSEEAERLAAVKNRHGVDPIVRDANELRLGQVDGACVFLELDGRCAVHAQLGHDAKPVPCRRFPFVVMAHGDERYVRASFACPTVVAARGKGPDEIAAELERDPDTAPLPDAYRLGARTLSPALYDRLEALLTGWFETAPDLARALAAAGALVAALDVPDLEDTFDARTSPEVRARLAADARPFSGRDARLLLTPFLLLGAPPSQGRLSRAFHAAKLLLGRGRFLTHAAPAAVPLALLPGIRFPPECERPGGLLRRYVLHLLRSRAFLVTLSVEMQVTLLGVAYALVRWNARARAALAGRAVVDESDLAAAVSATDLEHFAHNATEVRLLAGSWVGVCLDLFLRGPRRVAGLVLERA